MHRSLRIRSGALGAGLTALFLLLGGCTRCADNPFSFLKSRFRDALQMGDVGVTLSAPEYGSVYGAFFSGVAAGYGHVDGYFVGIGGGDIGVMRIHYNHIGLGVWGRERSGWGDGLLFDFGGFDVDKPETMHCQGVGPLGFLLPPYDRRPAGAPT